MGIIADANFFFFFIFFDATKRLFLFNIFSYIIIYYIIYYFSYNIIYIGNEWNIADKKKKKKKIFKTSLIFTLLRFSVFRSKHPNGRFWCNRGGVFGGQNLPKSTKMVEELSKMVDDLSKNAGKKAPIYVTPSALKNWKCKSANG